MITPFRRAAAALGALGAAALPALAVVGPTTDASPFAGRVVMILTRGPEGSGFCTGVVLSPRIVLTAAHCLRRPADMLVHFRDPNGAPVFLNVAAAAKHPGFVPDAPAKRTRSIDVGLVETSVPLPQGFRSTELSGDPPPGPGETTIVVGFGVAVESRPETGGALRAAELDVRQPRSSVLLWLEGVGQAGGACAGDSGGPVFSNASGQILAIVAWTQGENGHSCGALTQAVLVGPIRGWIEAAERRLLGGAAPR